MGKDIDIDLDNDILWQILSPRKNADVYYPILKHFTVSG